MSKKNQKRKQEMKEQQGCPRPWRQIDDAVVDAHGRIVCSWEGGNYNDGAAAAQIIVEAVNSQQSQLVPDEFYEAMGWMHAECCAALDRGEDPRQMEVPGMLERAIRDLTRD